MKQKTTVSKETSEAKFHFIVTEFQSEYHSNPNDENSFFLCDYHLNRLPSEEEAISLMLDALDFMFQDISKLQIYSNCLTFRWDSELKNVRLEYRISPIPSEVTPIKSLTTFFTHEREDFRKEVKRYIKKNETPK